MKIEERHRQEAAALHDKVHEVAALVSWPDTNLVIGWAPEESIPVIAQALAEAEELGYQRGVRAANQLKLMLDELPAHW